MVITGGLFEIEISKENMMKGKSSKFISQLKKQGLFRDNRAYFDNFKFTNKTRSETTAIILSIVKINYDHYIFEEGWEEIKFKRVIKKIIKDGKTISKEVIRITGIKYDELIENK